MQHSTSSPDESPDAHPRARRFLAALLTALLAALPCLPVPAVAAQAAITVTPYDLLVSPASTPDQRLAAAAEILQQPQPPAPLADAIALLTSDPTGGEAARALLVALAKLPQSPLSALPPTLALARDPSSPLQTDAVRALRSFRTREAAAALVELTSDAHQPSVRETAFRSLARLSARDDLGADAAAWRAWLARVLTLSDRQWEQELLSAHVRQSQVLQASLADGERRLVEAWRQIHLLSPAEGRSAVLVRLLASDLPVLRDLGFELVNREISESRVLEPTVAEAAIGLLQSADAVARTQAALLLNRLVPAEAETPLLAALARESDPHAAEALLLAASRWPSSAAVTPALRWLEATPALRLRAAGLAWALLRAGHLETPKDRQAVLHSLRSLDPAALNPPACRLLASLGDARDIAKLQSLVVPETEPALRAAAADALALRQDQCDFLLAAAESDPVLFEATARALRTHLQDARGYSALSRLPSPSDQIRSRVLADYATALPTEDLVSLAKDAPSPNDALALLNPLTTAERLGVAHEASTLAEGLLLLARAHSSLGRPAEALSTLAVVPQTPAPASDVTDLRATLLLWLNRIDEAEELDATPAAWFDALQRAVTEPHAAAIAERLELRFGDQLTSQDRERLARLRRELAKADQQPANGGG